MDEYVPLPSRHLDLPFLLPIESVLTISGRGTVVTGAVAPLNAGLGFAVREGGRTVAAGTVQDLHG